jgi:hypothetical protein
VIAGAYSEQNDVVVVVDETGHDGAAAQIDFSRARTQALIAAGTYSGESAILDRDLRRRGALPIHRHEFPVGQPEIARARARIDLSLARLAEHRDGRERSGRKHGHGAAPYGKPFEVGRHAGDCIEGDECRVQKANPAWEYLDCQAPTPNSQEP